MQIHIPSMSFSEAATLIVALGGLVLGLRSEWRAYRNDRVRLRVVPKIAYPVGPHPDYEPRLAFEIINEGSFPVTIDDLGFYVRGSGNRFAISDPIREPAVAWPCRLEPHSSQTFHALLTPTTRAQLALWRCAYVSTASGHTTKGNSNALKALAKSGSVPPFPRNLSKSGLPGFILVSDFHE